ncbi:MAG: twin-arginine translocase subunit TatC [Phycisphaerae bacterium]|nr:twin-arginine translocase subunit TatC [Phycisphaerae bacterium]
MRLFGREPRKPLDPDDVRMSFGEHLEELRSRIIRLLLGGLVGMVGCFIFREQMMKLILWPLDLALKYQGLPTEIQVIDPTETFVVVMKMSIYCGLIITAPYGLYQLWAFVAAGLYRHEQRFVRQFFPISVVLFTVGVVFCFTIVMPIVFSFLIGIRSWIPMPRAEDNWITDMLIGRPTATQPVTSAPATPMALPILMQDPPDAKPGEAWINPERKQIRVRMPDGISTFPLTPEEGESFVRPMLTLSFVISFVTRLALGFGLGFQVPIVVVLLAMTGIVSVATMASVRKYVLLVMVTVAAVVTPPDVTSQILLAVPMYLLYEGGLLAAKVVVRRRMEEQAAEGG